MSGTSVNIITHEQVVRLWNFSSDLEQLHKIMELSMDVTTNDDRCSDWDYIGFLSEYFFGLSVRVITFSQSALISD